MNEETKSGIYSSVDEVEIDFKDPSEICPVCGEIFFLLKYKDLRLSWDHFEKCVQKDIDSQEDVNYLEDYEIDEDGYFYHIDKEKQ